MHTVESTVDISSKKKKKGKNMIKLIIFNFKKERYSEMKISGNPQLIEIRQRNTFCYRYGRLSHF